MPNLQDVKACLDLRYLVKYLEHQFLSPEKVSSSWGHEVHDIFFKSPHLVLEFKENFHRAAYRYFILGAILSHAHYAPFFADPTQAPPNFLSCLTVALKGKGSRDCDEEIREIPRNQEEIDFLIKQFPVYGATPQGGWETCFGNVSEWLLASTRSRLDLDYDAQEEENVEFSLSQAGAAILEELLHIIVFFGQCMEVHNGLFDLRQQPFWLQHRRDANGDCICIYTTDNSELHSEEDSKVDATLPMRTIPIMHFGAFEPVLCSVASDSTQFGKHEAFKTRTLSRHGQSSRLPRTSAIQDLLAMLYCQSGQPSLVDGHPLPYPPLQLFSYILKRYFGLQFAEEAFDMDMHYPIYYKFIQNGYNFTSWGSSMDLLEPLEMGQDQQLSYQARGWSKESCLSLQREVLDSAEVR